MWSVSCDEPVVCGTNGHGQEVTTRGISFISKMKEMAPSDQLKNSHRAMRYTKHLISITYVDMHH